MPEDDEPQGAAARPLWSGTITFGLVSIPVTLFPAVRPQRVSLRMVAPDGTPVQRRYFNPRKDRELDWDDIVRGYEIDKDEFVVVTDDELERLAPDRSRDIDLRRFVDASELDPRYFERAYYLAPDGGSTKAYRLLAATMEETGRAGIATFVMRAKEYLVAILAENGILRAETLRFADEVRTPQDVGLPEPVKPSSAEVNKVARQIAKLVEDELPDNELRDREAERLLKLVEKKRRAGKDVVQAPTEEDEDEDGGVIDLMAALQRSLEGASGGGGSKRTATADAGDLEDASKDELYERAKRLDIPGRSGMSKRQLIQAIRKSA